ncbi:hypothetical protein CIB48_g143 [Xylaria polymorpha]|nr:hypothetical protein CIB48_g143 [Xylaria polymorpha]
MVLRPRATNVFRFLKQLEVLMLQETLELDSHSNATHSSADDNDFVVGLKIGHRQANAVWYAHRHAPKLVTH